MAKPSTPIPPDKIEENFAWRDWFQKLSDKVFGSMSTQDSNAVNITGGNINGTPIGVTTASTGHFTTLSLDTALGAIYGGTGQSSVAIGNILYGSAVNTWSKLAIGSTGQVLRVAAGIPAWGTDYVGTVTSVAALTLGTTGTDLSSTVATGTTTPVITLQVPTASASNRGVLSSTDWSTFNGKGSGTVTSVAATVPAFLSVSGSPVTTSGTLAITLSGTALPIANGGTGATTLAGASIATYTGTETLTNKRIDPRVTSAASASSLTPDISASDIYAYTALAAGLTINAPTGTPLDGDKLIFRLLDNGTSRALTWNATYTVIGVTLPTATTISKTTYVGCIYNANNTRWDVIAVTTQA